MGTRQEQSRCMLDPSHTLAILPEMLLDGSGAIKLIGNEQLLYTIDDMALPAHQLSIL